MRSVGKGSLLVASPEIDKGLYFHSVVLVCECTPTGSFGLLINKPLQIDIPEEIVDLKKAQNRKISIWAGGPIQMGQMMLLHSSPTIPDQVLKVKEDIYIGGDISFLQQAAGEENGPDIRLCFGYCGWVSGQLEKEVREELWFIHDASADYLFKMPFQNIWETALREMGGKYASLSLIPEDLSLN